MPSCRALRAAARLESALGSLQPPRPRGCRAETLPALLEAISVQLAAVEITDADAWSRLAGPLSCLVNELRDHAGDTGTPRACPADAPVVLLRQFALVRRHVRSSSSPLRAGPTPQLPAPDDGLLL